MFILKKPVSMIRRVKRQHNDVFSHINYIPEKLILICISLAEIWLI